ncbi:MAG TPA: UTP--glucose-1-phosphate uridylyltransferase [Solirubrobacteraceae bacterium]|jgi:UTP--glucose-1-phosphate uridylyltransferase|nr:UTP--glucose-1-phosphate uridylyltransferase [Solirubrobacteraceae bacterium]
MTDDELQASLRKMRDDGVSDVGVATFAHYFERLRAGDAGMLAESEIEPVDELPDADELPVEEAGARDALDRTVVLKLNGGLGTSMGMTEPKSLLEVKDGLTFLDIVVRQILDLRRRTGARLPLVLMNSFATRETSLQALASHDDLAVEGIPADFVQSKVPKLLADGFAPVRWPDDPSLEWAPPGHGDLYPSLLSSGMLDALLDAGYEYAFVANVDNLGAVMDERILAWFARERIPFLMEVADRTPADRKGGHLARRPDGGLVLREIAQTPGGDVDAFQDIDRHRFFNTNTLWIDLRALRAVLDERDGVLGLPMIVNRKTADPGDADSPAVLQLETAMGAAIDVFEGARAIRVPRERFAPVKTTNDLLALRSDAYELHEDGRIVVADGRSGAPLVDLDARHFKLVRDFDARFAAGAPSLVGCERLTVRGDVAFGADIAVRGAVEVEHAGEGQRRIADGTVLEG